MDIRLLGPFEVWQGSTRLALGAPKQRAVLAQLAIRVGEVTPAEALVDGLWPDEPPASAAKSIQVYVSNLRRILPPGAIATRGRGYALTADPELVDSVRFGRLVAAGRADLAAGRLDAAAAALRDGLALWRGPALGGLRDEAFAGEPAAALDEARIDATELLFGIDIERGRGPDVLDKIAGLVREQPLRETLRALQMRALYQAGRQADALAAYREARRVLDDELGVDPSPELQALERSILLQDRGLLGPPGARPRAATSAAERKLVTILVAVPAGPPDADPEQSMAVLDRFGRVLVEEIEAAGGRADRLADGAVRGVFGVPAALEDHAARALEAAVRARMRLGVGPDGTPWMHAAVDSGEVVAGSAEGGGLVIGPAADRAIRLASLAHPGAILAGSRAEALASRFSFAEPEMATDGDVRLGYRELASDWSGATVPPGTRSRFVGRQRELGELAARQRATVDDARPALVVLVGDAGIGKSRLVEVAAHRRSEEVPASRQLVGRCVSYGSARTYRPMADMLRAHLDLRDGDPADEVLRRLGSRSILGLAFGIDVAADAHPLAAQERLHAAWIDLVSELVAEAPLVLTLEDLHWADEPLLELVARLIEEVTGPLFIVATARPEFVDRWESWGAPRPRFGALWLEPLTPAEADRLASLRLAGPGAATIKSTVLDRAEGNPFFIEELTRGLRDETAQPGTVPGPTEIPDTIQATIAARIDRLPRDAKAALHVGSVIGREFTPAAVRSVLATIEPGMPPPALAVLEQREFVRVGKESAGPGEPVYAFKHALTRDVAYGSVPVGRRGVIHAAVGEWLLRQGRGRDEDAALLAHHFRTAATAPRAVAESEGDASPAIQRLRDQAVRWLDRAAELAIGRYELDAAERLLRQAIDLATDRATRASLWRSLAQIGFLRYDGPGFWSAMEQALELTASRAAQADMYGVLAEVTAIRRGMWRVMPPQDLLDGWIEHALRLAPGNSLARGRALIARAWTGSRLSPTRAADVAEAAELADRLGDDELGSHALGELAREELVHYRFDAARDVVRRHLVLWDRVASPDEQALILQQATANLLSCGALGEAADAARGLETLGRRLSPHHRLHAIAAELSVRNLRGSPTEVLDLVAAVRDRMTASVDTPCVAGPWSMHVAATAALRLGEHGLAADLAAEGDAWHMVGFDDEIGAQLIARAVLRSDVQEVQRLMVMPLMERWNGWFLTSIVPPYLDALVAIDDRARLESETRPLLGVGGLFEPFARRALAISDRDEGALGRAHERLLALGLESAAADTALLRDLFDRVEHGVDAAAQPASLSEVRDQ
jgi:DNA-binding SARP family transcriptional activator